MDLSKTIAELDKQAEQYKAAADALRQLSGNGTSPVEAVAAATSGNAVGRRPGRPANKAGAKAAKAPKAAKASNGKRYVSPETRAKIAAAIKARHEEKRRAREGR